MQAQPKHERASAVLEAFAEKVCVLKVYLVAFGEPELPKTSEYGPLCPLIFIAVTESCNSQMVNAKYWFVLLL